MEWIRYINAFWCLKDEFVQKLFHHLLTPMESWVKFQNVSGAKQG